MEHKQLVAFGPELRSQGRLLAQQRVGGQNDLRVSEGEED